MTCIIELSGRQHRTMGDRSKEGAQPKHHPQQGVDGCTMMPGWSSVDFLRTVIGEEAADG